MIRGVADLIDLLLDDCYSVFQCAGEVGMIVEDRGSDVHVALHEARAMNLLGNDLVRQYHAAATFVTYFHFNGRIASLLLEEIDIRTERDADTHLNCDEVDRAWFDRCFKDPPAAARTGALMGPALAGPTHAIHHSWTPATSFSFATMSASSGGGSGVYFGSPVGRAPSVAFNDPMGKTTEEMVIPDSIEPLLAWRAWRVDRFGSLQSRTNESVWPGREKMTGICITPYEAQQPHRTPAQRCTCGIYSVKTLEGAIRYAGDGGWAGVNVAIGKIKIWGMTVVAEKGYRSEFAYPTEIYLLRASSNAQGDLQPGDSRIGERLQRRYDVPVHCGLDLDDLIDMTIEEGGGHDGGTGAGTSEGPPDG